MSTRLRTFVAVCVSSTTLWVGTIPSDVVAQELYKGVGASPKTISSDLRSVQTGKKQTVDKIENNTGNVKVQVTQPDRILSADLNFRKSLRSVIKIEYITTRGEASCTGIAIARNTVLTAGHCACGSPTSYKLKIYNENSETDPWRIRDVTTLAIPFDKTTCSRRGAISPGFDLALLKIFGPGLVGEADIIPITNLLTVYRDSQIVKLTVIGYGRTEDGSIPDKMALAGHVPVKSFFCSEKPDGCQRFREFILAGQTGNQAIQTDSCGGDSGGPVVYVRPTPEIPDVDEILLVGITSRALPDQPSVTLNCGGGGIYTAIGRSDVLRWLDRNSVEYKLRLFTRPSVADSSQ